MNVMTFKKIMTIKAKKVSRSSKVVMLLEQTKADTNDLITLIGGEYRPAVSEARADGHNILCSKYKKDGRWIYEYTLVGSNANQA